MNTFIDARRWFYPDDWPDIAYAVKEAAGWCCMACGRQCRRPGELRPGWEYTLTVAHITQDYEAPEIQVAALCLPCHLRMDAPFVWVARRRWERVRRQRAGQLVLVMPLKLL